MLNSFPIQKTPPPKRVHNASIHHQPEESHQVLLVVRLLPIPVQTPPRLVQLRTHTTFCAYHVAGVNYFMTADLVMMNGFRVCSNLLPSHHICDCVTVISDRDQMEFLRVFFWRECLNGFGFLIMFRIWGVEL